MHDRASRFIAWALRHDPTAAGLTLDPHGWTSITDLLRSLHAHGFAITLDILTTIALEDAKGRFTISADGRSIRASYAHSVAIDLALPASPPPARLFHGTARHHLDSIKQQGLRRGSRRFVHLATTPDIAFAIGQRHGTAVVIPVTADAMHQDTLRFYQGSPVIWLTEAVPVQYLCYDALIFFLAV